ncbi:hypothetical protein AVEN_220027-1 [Araneus ventricosus]|uniref:Uncharacterized protein n=1 Tax=Araneus ventricosus TaxID=182803 RepID=A0A4Y2CTJ3_ARAVE|nr:hypothetical protein AVEN_220027-1 [Araneus ventricosus]
MPPNIKRCSLIALKARYETNGGLFWDGSRNFEPQSNVEDDTRAGSPSLSFRTATEGRRMTHEVGFSAHRVLIYGGSPIESGFEPGASGAVAKTLRQRHRGPVALRAERFKVQNVYHYISLCFSEERSPINDSLFS